MYNYCYIKYMGMLEITKREVNYPRGGRLQAVQLIEGSKGEDCHEYSKADQ
jgi:hypothetical protein